MKLSEFNNKTLMLSIHQKIEEYAEATSELLNKGKTENILIYPPDCSFTDAEKISLKKLINEPNLNSALSKIYADNSAGVIFDLMNLIDGTTDPDEKLGKWTEVSLIDKTEHVEENPEMLHNTFFSTYWDWKKSN